MDKTQASSSVVKHNHYFTVSDDVALNYLDFGSGRSIVMIPGWSQTAEMFREQLLPLSKHFRCIAIDMRGHGESQNNGQGFTIDRLATDVNEVIAGLDLEKPILLGHSMGASVLWRYIEKFGSSNVSKLVFVDQAPVLLQQSGWSTEQCQQFGAIFDKAALEAVCSSLIDPDAANAATINLLQSMFSEDFPRDQFDWVVTENLKFERASAAALLRDHCHHDWRSVITRIDVPSLVVGGKASLMPWQSQQWLSENIPNAKLALFEADEGGQHFMFLENPALFNKIVFNFCQ